MINTFCLPIGVFFPSTRYDNVILSPLVLQWGHKRIEGYVIVSTRVPVVKHVLLHLFVFKYIWRFIYVFLFLQACVFVLWISIAYPLKFWERYSPICSNLICWQSLIMSVITGTRLPFQVLSGKQLIQLIALTRS